MTIYRVVYVRRVHVVVVVQKQLRRFNVMQSSVHDVWRDLLEHSNLLRTANMWVPHHSAHDGESGAEATTPGSSSPMPSDASSVTPSGQQMSTAISLDDVTAMERCNDASTGAITAPRLLLECAEVGVRAATRRAWTLRLMRPWGMLMQPWRRRRTHCSACTVGVWERRSASWM